MYSITLTQFYLHSAFKNEPFHKAALQKSEGIFKAIISKPEATIARKTP